MIKKEIHRVIFMVDHLPYGPNGNQLQGKKNSIWLLSDVVFDENILAEDAMLWS